MRALGGAASTPLPPLPPLTPLSDYTRMIFSSGTATLGCSWWGRESILNSSSSDSACILDSLDSLPELIVPPPGPSPVEGVRKSKEGLLGDQGALQSSSLMREVELNTCCVADRQVEVQDTSHPLHLSPTFDPDISVLVPKSRWQHRV
ncbi:hypothetical protein GN956_G18555 [Arapaima gigas]